MVQVDGKSWYLGFRNHGMNDQYDHDNTFFVSPFAISNHGSLSYFCTFILLDFDMVLIYIFAIVVF
jgi:hypothetical protein